jgi:hypothetical protein
VRSNNSSLEESEQEGRPVKLDKQVSSTSSTGSTSTLSESPKQVEAGSKLVAPLAGGKDNRRISPEGMSPDGKTLSNESISGTPSTENWKNSLNKPEKTTKLIEEAAGDTSTTEIRDGVRTGKVGGAIDVGGASEPETQTPNLSQGSEVATDTTLSSLSLASVSSPPPSSRVPPLSSSGTPYGQQPETGQAAYSNSTSPLAKRSTSPSQSSHDSHVTPEKKAGPEPPTSPTHFNPLRSPLAKEKEKEKRARSLSPKFSRRIFPPSTQPMSPSVNVSQYDTSNGSILSPPHSTADRFAHFDLTRTDSPESVKSDVAAYSSSRKPLRSSLRAMRDKDSSSSSLDSGKVHISTNKVTISPRSSQVVFLPEESGLRLSAAFSQPTILSPAKRLTRGRPSSLSDNSSIDVEHGKRGSTASEKMDYSTEDAFLTPGLALSVSHQRYDSTPELLQTFENELSTMKKDLANKDRMLSMYENSMADLSSKVHHLKKTLEEKDQEIKHLTEAKQSLFDLDGRSLASRMSHGAMEVLSDGCLSDSAMEPGHRRRKGDEKKKKKWKRWSFRKKTKDPNDLSSTLDAESMISGRSGRSLSTIRRQPSKSKSDLMSISEYGTDMRLRDDVSFHGNSRKSSNSSTIMNVHVHLCIIYSVFGVMVCIPYHSVPRPSHT